MAGTSLELDAHADDEALGARLELHLEALSTSVPTAATVSADDGAELADLQDVIGKLHRFAEYLSASSAAATVMAPSHPNETIDFHSQVAISTNISPTQVIAKPAVCKTPSHVGKYEVIRCLGRGGQASALLALDPYLQRHVVIKRYHGASCEQTCRVFLSEGQALASIRSPYVAQVHSAEEVDDQPFLVVEYIRGTTLADVLAIRRPSLKETLRLIRQIAEGLAAIHACGLLHRDIKPANIILGEDGVPRLVDFGLAARVATDDLSGVSGTLQYMAPEQAHGDSTRISARSDLFGLGAVLYEMLTGRPIYVGAGRTDLHRAAMECTIVPLRLQRPELSASVDKLCMRCLAKDPGERWESAHDFVRAVDGIQERRRKLAASQASWLRLSAAGLVAAALCLAIVVGLPLYLLQSPPQRNGGHAKLEPPKQSDPSDGATLPPQPKAIDTKMPVAPNGIAPGKIALGPKPQLLMHEKANLDPAPPVRAKRRDFPIRVAFTDRNPDSKKGWELTEGDALAVTVEVDRPAHVVVWHVQGDDNIVQLFPNREETDDLVKPGEKRVIPADKSRRLTVTRSENAQRLHVIASAKPWPLPEASRDRPNDVYFMFVTPTEKERWANAVRALALPAPAPIADAAVAELVVPFQVRPK